MELIKAQYEKIKYSFPKHRKPAKINNPEVLNAMLYVVKNGCKWRSLQQLGAIQIQVLTFLTV